MTLSALVNLSLGAILIENFVLVRFLGVCPFLGVSKKQDTALGMSLAVIFVMTMASAAAWAVEEFLLEPFEIGRLRTLAFVLIIAALVQLVELFMQKAAPALHKSLGIYLPLITTNCAVLGVALINSNSGTGFIESVLFAFMSGVGFMVALMLFSSIRARLEFSEHPEAFEGFPIALVTAGLLALAFMGFSTVEI
ncbi:MAG: electron transport complex subunit RsxA [Oscillospiraceae bacterium]|nr:electron transport complex subunit RsxA [Oscillospiraceae bacterium]